MDLVLKEKRKYGDLKLYESKNSKNKGIILFIHGFNSSYKIWGDIEQKDSFFMQLYKLGYTCYSIDFSNTLFTSIVDLADEELEQVINIIEHKNKNRKLVLIAHSLGGVILRYFLDSEVKHRFHNVQRLKEELKISLIALLASPNHGIALSSSAFKNIPEENYNNSPKEFFQGLTSFSSYRKKINEKIPNNVLSELYYKSKLIQTINNNIATNLWPEVPIYNLIASDDIVVNPESAKIHHEEIDYHGQFYQYEFESVHMKNPLEWRELIEFLNLKEIKKIKKDLEDRIPGLKYFTLKPIYQNSDVINLLKEQLK